MAEMTEAYDWGGRVLLDRQDDRPGLPEARDPGSEWALVDAGQPGTRQTFVPVSSAKPSGEACRCRSKGLRQRRPRHQGPARAIPQGEGRGDTATREPGPGCRRRMPKQTATQQQTVAGETRKQRVETSGASG